MSAKKQSSRRNTPAAAAAFAGPLSETEARLALLATTDAVPAPQVREQLLARIRKQSAPGSSQFPPEAGLAQWRFGSLAAESGWVPLPFPGVRLREVAADRARDSMMLYIEMQPGSRFPDHTHSTSERGFVLTGDFLMDGKLVRAGEFYEAGAGTRHERVSSPSGCTGLLWVGLKAWQAWRGAMAAALCSGPDEKRG